MSGIDSKQQTDIRKYEEGWTREMISYWRERLLKLSIYRTGALYHSFSGVANGHTIEHRFLLYGIYVAAGVGNGYKPGNGGDLSFLKDWKTNSGHRKTRDWFSKTYFSSVMGLSEVEASFYGQVYCGLMATALQDIIGGRGVVRNL